MPAPPVHAAARRASAIADYVRVGVECEIAVRLGADLGPAGAPFDRARVAGGGRRPCMAAMEIVDDRYGDYRDARTSPR